MNFKKMTLIFSIFFCLNLNASYREYNDFEASDWEKQVHQLMETCPNTTEAMRHEGHIIEKVWQDLVSWTPETTIGKIWSVPTRIRNFFRHSSRACWMTASLAPKLLRYLDPSFLSLPCFFRGGEGTSLCETEALMAELAIAHEVLQLISSNSQGSLSKEYLNVLQSVCGTTFFISSFFLNTPFAIATGTLALIPSLLETENLTYLHAVLYSLRDKYKKSKHIVHQSYVEQLIAHLRIN